MCIIDRWMMAAGYEPRELAKLLSRWDQRQDQAMPWMQFIPVSYTHLRAHETVLDLVCRLLLEKKKHY